MFRSLRSPFILATFLSAFGYAGVQLPLHTLRDQANTSHCWAYASSHLLESRALVRGDTEFMIDTELDSNYWVNYERMMEIYRTKNKDIYLGSSQGGWQMEFWNTLLKHGKNIHHTKHTQAQILYPVLKDYSTHLAFLPPPVHSPDPSLPSFESLRAKFEKEFKTEAEASEYAIDYLDRYYGEPKNSTTWFAEETDLTDTASLILEDDFEKNNKTDSLVLIKPVTDGDSKWVKYLGERFWGYRYDAAKILELVEASLDKQFPVTFDNVFHAMTIIGYETSNGDTFYAVADSVPGKITWYSSASLKSSLNLVTFFGESIQEFIPPRPPSLKSENGYDQRDGLTEPPR